MKNVWSKIAIITVIVIAVAVIVAAKSRDANRETTSVAPAATSHADGDSIAPSAQAKTESKPHTSTGTSKKLPRIVDLGATKCIPCKMMAPILEEIKKDYEGKLTVEFIDVWENRNAGDKYRISSIPTQIFYDENGKEFSRHVGFMPKEDILATFKEHGIDFKE